MSSCGARCRFGVRERLRADAHKSQALPLHHLAPDRDTVLLKLGNRPKSKARLGVVLCIPDAKVVANILELNRISGTQTSTMKSVTGTARHCGRFFGAVVPCCLMLVVGAASPADAAGCSFEAQGEGRVAEILDARSFRLADGREVRLAGIEPVTGEKANRTLALAAIIAGRDVKLSGEDDTPDRYGRQPAFVSGALLWSRARSCRSGRPGPRLT